jgi:hypothetical protein
MYTLIRLIPLQKLFTEQAPVLGASIVIAELFYKFHSFTLECMAFLATWYVLDAALKLVSALLGKK